MHCLVAVAFLGHHVNYVFLLVLENVFLNAKRFFAVEDNCMVDNVFKCCKLFFAEVTDKHVTENCRNVQFRIFLFYLHR